MINSRLNKGKLTFSVSVVVRASRSEIIGEHAGALRVRISAPPVEGAANAELIKLLAKVFSVARSDVEIKSGERSKSKIVSIAGGDPKILDSVELASVGSSRHSKSR